MVVGSFRGIFPNKSYEPFELSNIYVMNFVLNYNTHLYNASTNWVVVVVCDGVYQRREEANSVCRQRELRVLERVLRKHNEIVNFVIYYLKGKINRFRATFNFLKS